MSNLGMSMLWFWICYILVTVVGIIHTVFNIYVLKMKPMDENGMGEGYEKTKPWHPLYNIILFSVFGWLYINGLSEPTVGEALITGAIWAGICIVFDVFGWVLIKHPWSLNFKEFYVDYQPWITLIYLAIFAGPVTGYLFTFKNIAFQSAAGIILIAFYSVYLGKMILQRKQGIKTDQIASKGKKGRVFVVELILKIATYTIVVIELISIFMNLTMLPTEIRIAGIVIAVLGDIVFATAVYTMRDSWRAGIAKDDKTELITSGIYSISRNPAFLGFYLVYIGILLMFFNWILLIFTVFAIIMLHIQVLQEEKHLIRTFGDEYADYKNKVNRYLGRH